MLQTLRIKNFALLHDEVIEFNNGFNVLVGETGYGKSLIIDALSFVLGSKANKLNIRSGENKCVVQAVFSEIGKVAIDLLNEYDIDYDDSVVISRSLSIDGKSDCRVNGSIVPVGFLKQLSELIVDTYAQNENVELLNSKNHISILDSYIANESMSYKDKIDELLCQLKDISSKIAKLGGDNENRAREMELLEYQIKDIENIDPSVGEDDELKQKIDKLSHYEKIFESINLSLGVLSGVYEKLSDAEHYLNNASRYDDSLGVLGDRLKSTKIEVGDIVDTLSSYNDLGYDQKELDLLNKRLDDIKTLFKKYGPTIGDVLSYLDKIKQDYDNILFGEDRLIELNKQKQKIINELYEQCVDLSNCRRRVAKDIECEVEKELKLLGFKNVTFLINFKDLPGVEDANFTRHGIDDVEFLLSANAGEAPKSLSKTISGGEMSRFMLALKNVFAKCFNTSTLIFDEVDTGVSGEIGQRVAERLAMLSVNYQIICITHLCQVTAMADNYIYVYKTVEEGKTYTHVRYLYNEDIIKYISVVSGAQPTEVALRFASELKEKAESFKREIKR